MKQFWKKGIVGIIMLAIFMAPFSAGIKTDDKGNLAINLTENQAKADIYIIESAMNKSTIEVISKTSNSVTFRANLILNEGYQDIYGGTEENKDKIKFYYDNIASNENGDPAGGIYIVVKEVSSGNKIVNMSLTGFKFNPPFNTTTTTNILTGTTGTGDSKLKPDTDYTIEINIDGRSNIVNWESNNIKFHTDKFDPNNPDSINTGAKGTTTSSGQGTNSDYFNCSWNPFSDWNCKIAATLYAIIFTPMAAFTWLAAKLLDFFVYYSTNNTSYDGEFVTKAWGAVRDIANIFFIIALLYVAIKTILRLNVTDNKKLVGAVIIVALIINFSLFTTKVVIDTSNILAKVFYNNITSVDESGRALDPGKGGQKSVSVGLVKQFDPQTIFGSNFEGHEGLFIFVTILSILLMGFMIYIFISISILFVTRVVSLWLSMIFSPIAFVSYTLPFDIPGFGHKEWWKTLFESAFLAPVFIFFLYIIILFGDVMKSIPYDISQTANDWGGYLDAAMKTIIPFVIIYILLLKAKKLAVKFSGEIEEMVSKVGNMAGGLALGAITGGAGFALRNTAGRVATNISESNWLKEKAAKSKIGASLLKTTRGIGASSFDVRGIKIGGMGLSSTLGKPQAGGFTKSRKDYVEKQEKFGSSLEMSEIERQRRGTDYIYSSDKAHNEIVKENIRRINEKRTTARADILEKSSFASNKIAAIKIREAGHNKAKKIQDAAAALASGEGSSASKTGGDGGGSKPATEHK